MLFCAAAVLAFNRVLEPNARPRYGFFLGLASGLGFWNSAVTLGLTLPLVAFALTRRVCPRLRVLALAGACLGASPWIAHNVVDPLDSFRTQPNGFRLGPRAVSDVLANARWIVMHDVLEFVVSRDTSPLAEGPARRALRSFATVDTLLLVCGGLALCRDSGRSRWPRLASGRGLFAAALGAAACTFGLKALSSAGDDRGFSTRYILPLWVVAVPVRIWLHRKTALL